MASHSTAGPRVLVSASVTGFPPVAPAQLTTASGVAAARASASRPAESVARSAGTSEAADRPGEDPRAVESTEPLGDVGPQVSGGTKDENAHTALRLP